MNSLTSNRHLVVFPIFLLAMVALGAPAFAQKGDGQLKSSEERAKAREEVSKSVAGRLVMDAITIREPDWVLSKEPSCQIWLSTTPLECPFPSERERKRYTLASSISEQQIARRALFSMPRSMGTAVPFKIGDRGEKVNIEGRMTGLKFRFGSLKVGIGGTNDEKLAERFAGHVLEAIKGLASK